jgi:hypothetical protein
MSPKTLLTSPAFHTSYSWWFALPRYAWLARDVRVLFTQVQGSSHHEISERSCRAVSWLWAADCASRANAPASRQSPEHLTWSELHRFVRRPPLRCDIGGRILRNLAIVPNSVRAGLHYVIRQRYTLLAGSPNLSQQRGDPAQRRLFLMVTLAGKSQPSRVLHPVGKPRAWWGAWGRYL